MGDELVLFALAAMLWLNLLHDAAILATSEQPGFRFKLSLLMLCTAFVFLIMVRALASVAWRLVG